MHKNNVNFNFPFELYLFIQSNKNILLLLCVVAHFEYFLCTWVVLDCLLKTFSYTFLETISKIKN